MCLCDVALTPAVLQGADWFMEEGTRMSTRRSTYADTHSLHSN